MVGLLGLAGAPTLWAQTEDGWKPAKTSRGVSVAMRDVAGRDLPVFRGRGLVQGELLHVLAVVLDGSRACEWAATCKESRTLKVVSPRQAIVYSRSDPPWPISDRDVVMRQVVQVRKPGRHFRVDMRTQGGVLQPTPGVVRITRGHVYFDLQRHSPTQTRVEYYLDLDPRGSLPRWLVRWATRNVPVRTIRDLEAQVARTRGQYEAERTRWAGLD